MHERDHISAVILGLDPRICGRGEILGSSPRMTMKMGAV